MLTDIQLIIHYICENQVIGYGRVKGIKLL